MIVAKRKPFAEIQKQVFPYKKILIVGCGTCVAVCLAGGEKEVGILASQLRIANKLKGHDLSVDEITLERQCDREFIEPLAKQVNDYNALISTACGAGVQLLAELYPDKPVLPALDTTFIGVAESLGIWTERCRACSNCILGLTGGICPITICPKGLVNGPCGGTINGMCEVDPDRACAWAMIYERLQKQEKVDNIRRIQPPKHYDLAASPGLVIHEAYKKRNHKFKT